MRRALILLLPLAVLALSITYAGFQQKLDIGTATDPNTVQTGYLKWNVYLPSELGDPWNWLPDCIDGVFVPNSPYIIVPENPDVGNVTIQKSGDTVRMSLINVYPGYLAVGHFIYKYDGSVPSKLRNVNVTIYDPYGLANHTITAMVVIWNSGNPGDTDNGAIVIGYPLTELSSILKSVLKNVTFVKGGYIAFCKPNDTNVTITKVLINPDSGLTTDQINALEKTDSFWVIVLPDETPPQGAFMSFNITLTFGQFNEP